MTVIQQTTKYKCNGCGFTTEQPHGWRTLAVIGSGMFVAGASFAGSEDYCQGCVRKIHDAVKYEYDPGRPVPKHGSGP